MRETMRNGAPPLRPVHVIAGLDPAYGGPSYSVPRLCEALAAAGAEPVLLSVAPAQRITGRDPPGDASLTDTAIKGYADRRFAQDLTRVPGLRALRCSAAFSAALKETAAIADIVHDHGLWLLPNLQAGWAAAASGKAFVVSPRGMLSLAALTFSAAKKRVFWKLLQGPVISRAVCLHATSGQEYAELRAFGLRHPIAVIPNGIELPAETPAPAAPRGAAGERTVLSLGRMHPKKGLETLLRAWAAIEQEHPGWRLSLIGPGEDRYIGALRAMARGLDLRRVSFGPAVYGAAKWDAYRAADLFVLSSLNENFGLTAAEALASGIPVIATTGTPWSRLQAEGSGWWVEPAPEALAASLATAMAMPRPALQEMGMKGRAWMAREFSWHGAACDMVAVYSWLIGRADKPPSVRLA
jgi:glycosyltransferase involved in cell wall biosynthesis